MSELQPTTMKDIAEHFGVSIATVSRALNGSARVSEEKRNLICEYAHAHNFYPNDIAKSLRNSHKQPVKVIGVIVPEFTHYYFSTILNGIEDAASKRGYRIIATTSREQYEREVQLCQMFEAHQVCGVIVSQAKETQDYAHFQSLIDRGIRSELDDRAEKIGYKIREAQLEKIPYMIVVGEKEQEENTVSLRSRKEGDLGSMPLSAFIEKVEEQVRTKELNI